MALYSTIGNYKFMKAYTSLCTYVCIIINSISIIILFLVIFNTRSLNLSPNDSMSL